MDTKRNLTVSISKSKQKKAHLQTRFKRSPLNRFSDLAETITHASAWSPIIWTDDYRLSRNFESCSLIVLDYDAGDPSLAEMLERVKPYRHIVGVTKSHQKMKKGLCCDRFRVILQPDRHLPLAADQFKWTMVNIMRAWPIADASCKDQARFFWPCRDIVSIADGKLLILPKPPDKNYFKRKLSKHIELDKKRFTGGQLPVEINEFITYGACPGERRPSLFKYAARLTRLGWSAASVESKLLTAPFDRSGISDRDIERQIRRGIEVGNGA